MEDWIVLHFTHHRRALPQNPTPISQYLEWFDPEDNTSLAPQRKPSHMHTTHSHELYIRGLHSPLQSRTQSPIPYCHLMSFTPPSVSFLWVIVQLQTIISHFSFSFFCSMCQFPFIYVSCTFLVSNPLYGFVLVLALLNWNVSLVTASVGSLKFFIDCRELVWITEVLQLEHSSCIQQFNFCKRWKSIMSSNTCKWKQFTYGL